MSVPARTVALLTNPAAGGDVTRCRLAALQRLREAGLIVHDLQGRDARESSALARESVAAGIDALVVCGGDGLVHLASQVLAGTQVPMGIIPAGSGNDAARALGLPRTDPLGAADRVIAGQVRTIDLARIGDRYFVTVLAAGFDAVVNERANQMTWPRGQMKYNMAALAELRTFRPLSYHLDLDGERLSTEAMLVAVGNGPSFGGGLRITEGASFDDGLLDVVVIGSMSRVGLVRTYPRLFRGTHVTHPQFSRHRVRSVRIAGPAVTAYADGERFGPLPMTIESAPAALGVLV